MADQTYLVLGGGGMIGFQIARRICRYLDPKKMIIASLFQQEVREAISPLEKEYPEVEFVGFWGDVFVRSAFNVDNRQQRMRRSDLLKDPEHRAELYEDLFGNTDEAYQRNQLVQLIFEHQPDVIVDAINTATAISYQDIYAASEIARQDLDAYLGQRATNEDSQELEAIQQDMVHSMESLLISLYIPQLVRHVVFINRAMREVGTHLYLKVGTTGTGGMGLNIPYTHGEDKPSAKLMSKTAIAFAHTGLLFLMARTQGGPIVKEVKPAALVGWVDITVKTIRRGGKSAYIFGSRRETVKDMLDLQLDERGFDRKEKLKMVVADTGENGMFTKGEFESITALRQMEFITPEEIARAVVLEIEGINTGKDVIPALDSAVMGPTYRAGYLRRQAVDELRRLEAETGIPSVALGELGPPEISKLLWEAFLLKQVHQTLNKVLEQSPEEHKSPRFNKNNRERAPEEISTALHQYLQDNPHIQDLITSVGVPILLPDGETMLRGPFIRIPEVAGRVSVPVREGHIDQWAAKGWVDLRPKNTALWQERFHRMNRARQRVRGSGSAAVNREAYLYDDIFIGEVVGWVFNTAMGGYRIK